MEQIRSCALCAMSFEEDMLKGRMALRCGAEGRGHGRVTVVFAEGHRAAMEGLECPVWCTGYSPLSQTFGLPAEGELPQSGKRSHSGVSLKGSL